MSDNYYFKTVKFGGFNKEEVLLKIKDLVESQNDEIEAMNHSLNIQIEKNVNMIEKNTQIENSCEALKQKNISLIEYNELLSSKIVSKDIALKEYIDKFNEISRQENKTEAYSNKLIKDTSEKCERMLYEAKLNASTIMKNCYKEKIEISTKLEKEYQEKRTHLSSLINDYQAFENHISETLESLKETITNAPNDLKENLFDNE